MKRKKRLMMVAILLMAIGFASVTTTLILNGTLNIRTDDSFKDDVVFTRAETESGGTSSIDETGKTITFTSKELAKVGESTTLDFSITNNNLQYDATASIECATAEEYSSFITVIADKASYEITAGNTIAGNITTTLNKSYTGSEIANATFTCTLNVLAGERTETGTAAITTKYKTGDEVAIGDENFYVLSDDGKNVRLLSKYNLHIGTICTAERADACEQLAEIDMPNVIKQDSLAAGALNDNSYPIYGATPFASTTKHGVNYSSYEGSLVEEYVNNYVNYINSTYNITVEGSLISYLEASNLKKENDFITTTSYWTETSGDYSDETLRNSYIHVISHTDAVASSYDAPYKFGVRPVIKISSDSEKITKVAEKPGVTFISGDGTHVGDEFAIGNEHFYILSRDENYTKLMTKYNLDVGGVCTNDDPEDPWWQCTHDNDITEMQLTRFDTDYERKGMIVFSSQGRHGKTNSTYRGSIAEYYTNKYRRVIEKESNLIVVNATIPTWNDLESAGCNKEEFMACATAPEFIRSTNYWTMDQEDDDYVYTMYTTGLYTSDSVGTMETYGIRPIIKVLTSTLK